MPNVEVLPWLFQIELLVLDSAANRLVFESFRRHRTPLRNPFLQDFGRNCNQLHPELETIEQVLQGADTCGQNQHMTITAAAGHACGMDFKAASHIAAHPEFDWQKPLERDMDAYPWTAFTVAQ